MKAVKLFFLFYFSIFALVSSAQTIKVSVVDSLTADSLGACQGVYIQGNNMFLYGDREVGVIRKYSFNNNELQYSGKEIQLTVDSKDVINHPTGIAYDSASGLAFIGNSSRLNKEGTLWKANIFLVKWDSLINGKSFEESLIREIEDDACIQGTRPVMLTYKGKQYVATSDYGNKANEVRLYDLEAMKSVSKTSEKGVLQHKFSCSPWVQNLCWIPEKNILVLIQNQIEGRYWRLTFLDFEKSISAGKEQVIKVIDIGKSSELEGFALLSASTAIATTSSRKNNVSILSISIL